jgi:predicted nucleic acid-binding protein
MLVLDTDVLIDVLRGHAPAVAWLSSLAELPSVPGIVVMELIQGSTNRHQLQDVLKLVAPLPVIWPTEADSNQALTNFAAYHLSHNIGLLDTLIAATAVGLSATLCTFNEKHYRIIPNLTLAQPYPRWA